MSKLTSSPPAGHQLVNLDTVPSVRFHYDGSVKRLRIPIALGFAVVGAAAGVAAIGCKSSQPPVDAHVVVDAHGPDALCMTFCIPNGTDAGVCPQPAVCVDSQGNCPPGCEPEPLG